jgi:hypothetical protein
MGLSLGKIAGCMLLTSGLAVTVFAWTRSQHGERPEDSRPAVRFSGKDVHGRPFSLGASSNCRGIVVVFLGADCPISEEYVPLLNNFAEAAAQQHIEFYGVLPDRTVGRIAASEYPEAHRIGFPVLYDPSGLLYEQLRPTHTPQAFVLDADGRRLYAGRIDDQLATQLPEPPRIQQDYLSDALKALAAGARLPVRETTPLGTPLPASATERPSEITFCRDIAPLLQAHCTTCHRAGEVGPFALTSYEEASKRAQQLSVVTESQQMPPWKPERGVGHFRDERSLTPREIELLSQWAAAGAPEGNPDELPPADEYAAGWRLGEPDLIVQMPEAFDIPPDGPDIYQYFVIPSGLYEDRMLAAVEFRPSNPRVVHHASFTYDTSGAARRLDDEDPGPGYQRFGSPGFQATGSLGGWAAGVTPRRLPEGTGRLIQRDCDIVVQVHYHPTGKPERDQSTLGLFFAPRSTRQQVLELPVADMRLDIPAGASRFRHATSYTLPVDLTILSAAPHMHWLGREMRAVATLPDGRRQPLIHISAWDFNWQDAYFYAKPLRLPRGTRIDVEAIYDNSSTNPANPRNPPVRVRWGERSEDEMAVCFFDVTSDRSIDLQLLRTDNDRYIEQTRARLAQRPER